MFKLILLELSNFYIVMFLCSVICVQLIIFNLFNLLIYMELIWVCYFLNLVIYSQITSCYIFFTFSLYLFSLATTETTIGLLIIFFKNSFGIKQFNLNQNPSYFFNKTYLNRINAKIK